MEQEIDRLKDQPETGYISSTPDKKVRKVVEVNQSLKP